MALSSFHPAIQSWFNGSFKAATSVQKAAWSAIREHVNVLIAAPTGSGKTFAAFLNAINELVIASEKGPLPDAVQVLYVSPLKALSNDIERNLQAPLAGIEEWMQEHAQKTSGIRAAVRTGDTPQGDRERMRRTPPHILVTTPESLYLLLTSDSGRNMLSTVSTVIVDEIHAVAASKRGSHLALSLSRLDALVSEGGACGPRRIGLSATQKPIETIASFLTGGTPCEIVDTGHQRERDLALQLPESPLTAVMSNEVWEEIYDRLEALVLEHRTTLIFVNTRRLAERLARSLAKRLADSLGEEAVTAHHGSLSRDHRLEAEQALKHGRLRALVATASLELGIDIGHVDLVCQIGSPGSISAFIQRVGRAGHGVGETPKGRLFPVSRDDLVESVALMRSVDQGLLDTVCIPEQPQDVLAQQIIAEVSAREWSCDALFNMVIQAWPYRELDRSSFDQVVSMLAGGYATRRGRRSAFVYHDAVNGRLRARPAARLTALQNGGAIPDHFDYEVLMMPQGFRVGTLNEDFAFESLPGDIFQLGNTSYKILKIEQGRVLVEDAHGQPPTIPFWFGDAPGRSDELSQAVSTLRMEAERLLQPGGITALEKALRADGLDPAASEQLAAYLAASREALDGLPTQDSVYMERFFDDTGDMHLVIHAPFGSRIMRAWGLSLRKRFCRNFNFELQASALEDCLILSLGETHSFETREVSSYLKSASVRDVLIQALLDVPMFETRWRWNATIALAVQRMRNGKKLPPQWQRNQAEDLVAVVFPDQLACLENIRGEREIPDHPLVQQTIGDCLTETMDIDGLVKVLRRIEQGDIEIHCLDLNAPSPLAAEIINARPYAFLDDGEAENRRTRAISQSPDDLGSAATLSIISVEAEQIVRTEAWIRPANPDELHDGLMQLGFLTAAEIETGLASTGAGSTSMHWQRWFNALSDDLRAVNVRLQGQGKDQHWWVATERLAEFLALHPNTSWAPDPASCYDIVETDGDMALVDLLRARLSGLGPVSVGTLAEDFALETRRIEQALLSLQAEGFALVMGGDSKAVAERNWCERRLLARIHRYSRDRRRKSVRPVSPSAFMRFLVQWHGLTDRPEGLDSGLSQLEGWAAPAASWEYALIGARCSNYAPHSLDERFLSGELTWFRPVTQGQAAAQLIAATPISMVPRERLEDWRPAVSASAEGLGSPAQRVLDVLSSKGAMFSVDLARHTGLLHTQLEQALAELVARGMVVSDAFSPLRWLIRPEAQKRKQQRSLRRFKGRGQGAATGVLGRWSAVDGVSIENEQQLFRDQARLAIACSALLRRYGVVFRAVVERESLLPPWRYLLSYLRRMEDRGEVRGGRFVDGFSGEQFALPEAVRPLRKAREEPVKEEFVVISAADPLNLGGIITPGQKTPLRHGNRILLRNGVPVARLMGEELELLEQGRKPAIDSVAAERHLRVVHGLAKARP